MKHLFVAAGITAATAALAGPALAEYPEKPVEFIVPWSPGGGSDTLMRIVSNNIEPYLGVALPVINMPGVSGTVGLREASRRAADGYTVSQVHEGLLTSTATGLTDLSWEDFDPISLMVSSVQFLIVDADAPYTTLEEFVAYGKENPGEITMGVTLAGVPHLHAAMIEDAYGLQFQYVGYEGTGERVRALVGGNLDAAIADVASAGQFVENGDIRYLAVGATQRVPQAPDVPTFVESGADLELVTTRGLVMPKGSPQEARDAMAAALEEVSKDPNFIEQVRNAGGEVDYRDQEAYRAYLTKLTTTVDRLSSVLAP